MAATQAKVIVTCAITGAIHTPTMSPHLPITAEEIAQEAIAAGEGGRWPADRAWRRNLRDYRGGTREPARHGERRRHFVRRRRSLARGPAATA